MEQSKSEFLDGSTWLIPGKEMPDDLFYTILEIDDTIEQRKFIEALRNMAKEVGRVREFDGILKAFITDFIQSKKQQSSDQHTHFFDQPVELCCGQWRAEDTGVSIVYYDSKNLPQTIYACPHPIMPVEILKNVDTNEERICLAYFKYGEWQRITVDRDVCADAKKIVSPLSKNGVEVTSENAKYLVRYISDCIGLNPVVLKPKPSINRLGWMGKEFMPYAENIRYEGDSNFEASFRAVCQKGDYQTWKTHCSLLRKNKVVRLAFAVSASSVILELVHALPYVFHLWSGKSGTCKTVAIMAAMSIWGNPTIGNLVKTLDGTKVGLTQLAAFLYSLPLACDELQTIKTQSTTSYDQLIYRVTEGIDRIRGRASGGIQATKTWRNTFLSTGEEPITKSNSRSGSKNRVIEIEANEKLMEDGNATAALIGENFGFAGPKIIRYLQDTDVQDIRDEYKKYFDAMCHLDTTEKQAMAMACILIADRILTEVIFTDETPLNIDDVKAYLRDSKEVDMSGRAYENVLNWIAKNPIRFQNPVGPDATNKGEVWGRIDGLDTDVPVAVINKDVLADFLDKSGYDYTAVSKEWAARNYILKNSQGKFVHQTKVYGIKSSYIKINMQPENKMDNDGFIEVDGQMELPFS